MKKIITFLALFFSIQSVFTQDSIKEISKKDIQKIDYIKTQENNKNADMNLLMQAYINRNRNKMLELLIKNGAKPTDVIELAIKLDNEEIFFWLDESEETPSITSRSQ